MKDRVYKIRKDMNLSQEVFGRRLGVTGASISRIEKGERAITEQMIRAICREYNVRENWLRNGEGNMFIDFTEDEFTKAAATLSNDPFVRSIIIEYWRLDNESKQLFRNFIYNLAKKMQSQELQPTDF